MRILLTAALLLAIGDTLHAGEVSTFRAYVDSDLCARLMLGPITPTRIQCSQRLASEGSGVVLVRLSNNMVLSVDSAKAIRPLIGQLVEVSGELKASSGTVKVNSVHPITAESIPPRDRDARLLDARNYNNNATSKLYQQIRFQLARIPYVTDFDFVSFTLSGQDVILTGWTVRDVNRTSAIDLVRSVPGVESVIDNIEWIPLTVTDDQIRYEARNQLRQKLSNYFENGASDIRIIVKNGTVILVGAVANRADFDTAFKECNRLPWVTKVFNMLQIRPGAFGQ